MSDGAPFFYDYMNRIESSYSPQGVYNCTNKTFRFFQKYLLEMVISHYKFRLPKWWDKDYTCHVLFENGFFAVFDSKKFNVIPQACTLGGYNVFYRPRNALVANMLLPNVRDLTIGKNCEIVHINDDYSGVLDIVNYYAEMMALTAETTATNIQNSKLAYVFCAQNKAMAESFKKLFDDIMAGKPAVVVDKSLFNANGDLSVQMFNQSLGQTYIADKLLCDLKNWELEFCNKVGIPNTGKDKEQYISDKAIDITNQGGSALSELWLEHMKEDIEKVNAMFGLDCSVEVRKMEGEEAQEDDESDSVD